MLKEDVSPCIFGPVHKQRWSYACAKQMTDRLIYGKQKNSCFCVNFDIRSSDLDTRHKTKTNTLLTVLIYSVAMLHSN